jgi:hypothetical protein
VILLRLPHAARLGCPAMRRLCYHAKATLLTREVATFHATAHRLGLAHGRDAHQSAPL